MSGTVTPARRSRLEDEDDDVAGRSSLNDTQGRRSKRARIVNGGSHQGSGDEEDEGGEDENDFLEEVDGTDQPLLPDNFRRSPKGKQRQAFDRLANGNAEHTIPQKHQPGSIVRVTLSNFVTYTKAEFHPGPNLNMIIGPNGTGKSTLVCAICLGLGWTTQHLGRAKDIGEFVKHGAGKATIEIELAADPRRHDENPIITTKIIRDGSKTEFLVSGEKSNRKKVLELARSFSIQVDNLCQFLPQDRVVEFAALSPVELLVKTQQAAASEEVNQQHTQLKRLRKEQKVSLEEQQSATEQLKSMETRQRLAQPDVERFRERSKLQDRVNALERLRPFPAYRQAREQHTNARALQKEAQKELRSLHRRLEPNMRAVDEKAEYCTKVEKAVTSRRRLVERTEQNANGILGKARQTDTKLEDNAKSIEVERASVKNVKQSIPRFDQEINRIQKTMEKPPPELDAQAANEASAEKRRAIRETEEAAGPLQESFENMTEQARQRKEIIVQAEADKTHLQSQVGQQQNKLRSASRDSAQAWAWIQQNLDKFHGEVFGPPILECSVKDQRQANAVESMVNQSELMAFTVTNQADFKMLQAQLYTNMRLQDINIRLSLAPLAQFQPPCSNEQLQSYGLEGWLMDLIEGPDAVLAMLCDNRNIHQTAYTSREMTQQQYTALQNSPISSWVTRNETYMIARRREYGDQGVSTRVNQVKTARFFTDQPVDRQGEQELDTKIATARGEMEVLAEEQRAVRAQMLEITEKRKQLQEEKKAIDEDKAARQSQLAQFQALPTRLEGVRAKRDAAMQEIAGSKQRQEAFIEEGEKICIEKGQLALDYANAVEGLRNLHVQLIEMEIVQIEAQSDLARLQAQHAEEQKLIDDHEQEVARLTQITTDALARGKELTVVVQRLGPTLTEYEMKLNEDTEVFTPEQMETEIASVQARLEMASGGSETENTIRQFEDRARKIDRKHVELRELTERLSAQETEISRLMDQWKPELEKLIGHISSAFKENFEKIQCAGEVGLREDEDFDQWAIEIRVKFRETEQLSVLDSHRQSGGERAVSTIFYLMALQSLARAPFRVVDEINQGMDPRNERLVHSRVVSIACEGNTAQYFLITPKLLNGLMYHPAMKVHCIASGENMPEDHRELDFSKMAEKALALRGFGEVTG
ncbi:hypothetical protein MBLNU230_g1850t1 [Neophaeotheca triangularis]